ncbi:E3 ubiquitin-protein ligase RAD18, partial [Cyphomyrmex costatus]
CEMTCIYIFLLLQRIDALLQCGICYDYMDTSVITSCSHSYCSLCIRKYLHHKTQCPICFEEIFEKDLRKNKLVDEIIIQYLNFKEKHDEKYHKKLITVKNANSGVECKNEQDILNVSCNHLDNSMLMSGNTTPPRQKDNQQDVSTPSTSTDSRIPSIFTPKSRKGFQKEENRQIVNCPVCKVEVPQSNINRHLDDCLRRENTKDQPKKSELKRKPLPKLVYSLMKDNVIRKRLKELGLSSQGDKKALQNRLQRYTILYNAECDKMFPRPISELIKQCEEEEDLEKKVQKSNSIFSNITRNTEDNIIEQKRKEYLATNKESFDKLVVRLKHNNDPQKISVERNILNEENSDVLHNDCVTENKLTFEDRQISNFLSLDSINYIEDSNSNMSYPLQSRKCPMDFVTVELDTLSNDDQCVFNHDISNNSNITSPDSFNPTIKMENIKTEELSSESILKHEKITSNNHPRQCDVLKNEIGIDIAKSVSEIINVETKNEEQTSLFNRNRSNTKYSSNKHVAHFKPRDRWQKELHDENIDLIVDDVNNIEDNYEKLNYEQLNEVMEEYATGTKSEKENMKTDKDLTTWTPRKREREMAFALSDEEKIADRTMNVKKSLRLRLGLSEAKGFNNENFGETMQDEGKSQSEKEQSQVIRTNNVRNFARKSVRLRNKMNKN